MKQHRRAPPPVDVNGKPRPRSILIIVTRRIGDVLLATPLMRSIKRAWPDAALDVLVFEGTQDVIAANTDVRRVITVPERPRLPAHFALLMRLARRYDIALSTLPGDRPTLYAFVAGRWRAGLLGDERKERWKQKLLHRWVSFDNLRTHTVLMNLALAKPLGIAPSPEVTVSWNAADAARVDTLTAALLAPRFAVLHPHPKFNYKMWRRDGWSDVAHWFAARGYGVVLSGGGDAAEAAYVAGLAGSMPPGTINLAGKLTLPEAGCMISRAAVFVGPDTALTHMAAALGVPTAALYGPTDPVKWGPWPRHHASLANPWKRLGSQASGRVRLIQGGLSCVPCLKEGCGRRVESYSDCLLQLPAAKVISAIESLLRAESALV